MKKTVCMLMILLLLFASGASAEIYYNTEPPEDWQEKDMLTLTAFQCMLNDSALLEVGGTAILIDGGFKGQRFAMENALAGMGYEGHVDIFYNTHPHDDHIGAVQYMVREGFTADCFMSTFPEDYPDEKQQLTVETLKKQGIPYRQIANGETQTYGDAVLTFYYYPDGRDPNALSSILHIAFGDSSILMTGDITNASMRYFHANLPAQDLRADIMKAPHHGILPSEPEFLEDVDPQFVYVTNYTWATEGTTRQLKSAGITAMHTTVGRIVMTTDGTDWYIRQYKDMN